MIHIVRLLVMGGSWFVGKALVSAALKRDWEVTVFNRGLSHRGMPGQVRHIRGDWERAEDLLLLRGHCWDVVIDVAGAIPALVRDVVRAVSDRTSHYVYLSTVSVYREWPHLAVDEASALWPGDPDLDPGTRRWDPDAYGPLKAGCELAIRREMGERALFLRSHVILGPGEYVGRLPWWLRRMERGGAVLAPAPASRPIQPIDVRDLARFALDLADRRCSGTYNVAAPRGRDTYADLLEACRRTTGSTAEVEWVDERWLVEQGVRQWTELPLWRALPTAWDMHVDKAQAAGLTCRPLLATVADTWQWLVGGGAPILHERQAEHGIDAQREADLLSRWRRKKGT
ncbi:hypothetical protein ACTWPW_57000 [Nonomuraea sp. KM90]